MDPIVHFELPAKDLDRAKKFYSSLFGWKLDDWPMPDGSTYVGAHTTPIDEKTHMPLKPGAINGGIVARSKDISAPIFAINVASIDDKVKQIEKAGGRVTKPKSDVMGMGFYAYVEDTEGNVIGLWEDLKKAS
jgi:hypothetical protein